MRHKGETRERQGSDEGEARKRRGRDDGEEIDGGARVLNGRAARG